MDKNAALFIYSDCSPAELRRSVKEIEIFRKRHAETEILVVSFHDSFPLSIEQEVRCLKWGEVFVYEELFQIWSDAYAELNLVIADLLPRARELVEIYYHDVAFMLWQLKALPAIMAKQQVPTCYLVPALWQKLNSHQRLNIPDNEVDTGIRFLPRRIDLLLQSLIRSVRQVSIANKSLSFRGVADACVEGAKLCLEDPKEFNRRLINWILYRLHLNFLYQLKQVCRKAEKISIPGTVQGTVVVMTVEDGGSWVNLRPALRIAKEFKARQEGLVVISSSNWVVQEFANAGHSAIWVCNQYSNLLPLSIEYKRFRGELAINKANVCSDALAAVLCWLDDRGMSLIARKQASNFVLDAISKQIKVSSMLTVYEVLPLSILAGYWAMRRNVPWVGFFPILVGDRPDAYHFPASEHLVYGDQLRNIIVSDGHRPDSVVVTGSPTYDDFVLRDAEADRDYCLTKIPAIGSRRLVVLATEGFPDPLTEIEPVLDALASIEGIFVVLKVHPADSVEFFERYVSIRPDRELIQVVGACDLGALLHTADLLICIISNIIISAAVLGTPTLVCDFSNKRKVIDFVAAGLCRGCFAPDAVPEMVKRIIFDEDEMGRTKQMLSEGARKFNGPCDGQSASRIVEHLQKRSREYLAAHAATLGVPPF